jgi:hypothetical protein
VRTAYEIFPGYTLLSLAGDPTNGVVGGTLSAFLAKQTDKILVNDQAGVARFYYYDTQFGQWRRPGSSGNQNALVVSPLRGSRLFLALDDAHGLTFTGAVPVTAARTLVPTTATALFASYTSYFPASLRGQ